MNIEDQITILKKLGDGTFAITYLIQNNRGERLAMKVIDMEDLTKQRLNINFILNEIQTLISLSSVPNIIHYHSHCCGYFYGRETMVIFSDYIEGITLDQYIQDYIKLNKPPIFKRIINYMLCTHISSKPLPPRQLIKYMKQLLIALVHVHQIGFAHCDIKPENIIYDTQNDRMILIDFGLACSHRFINITGSPFWMPPELFSANPPRSLIAAQAHDIWSLGLVFYELANFKLPYDDTMTEDRSELGQILEGPFESSEYSGNLRYDNKINYMIEQMLTKNWKNRPLAAKLLQYINSW